MKTLCLVSHSQTQLLRGLLQDSGKRRATAETYILMQFRQHHDIPHLAFSPAGEGDESSWAGCAQRQRAP